MGMTMKRHDLLPRIDAMLTDNSVPLDVSTATSITAIAVNEDGTPLFARLMTLNAPAGTGWVYLDWRIGDTAVSQRIFFEFQVIWPDGKPQTFPGDAYEYVDITDDLDNGPSS